MFKLAFASITTSVLALKLDLPCEGMNLKVNGWYSDANNSEAVL